MENATHSNHMEGTHNYEQGKQQQQQNEYRKGFHP